MAKKGNEAPGKGFSEQLLRWDREQNRRQMPWKGEKDPYKIWLSEIILQQTRVEHGVSYYNEFVRNFPDIKKLANASEEKIFKLWEGLGYYSRCRNLIATARSIALERNGVFPKTYEEIVTLKGVGPYTAAAISSFAFNLPYAVVDGNVFRVLARIFGIDTPIDSTEGKKYFAQLANELIDKKKAGAYNQAIMDFGAMICKPVPHCDQCVFNKSCYALLNKKINELPVKEKKISIKKRWFYYLLIEHNNQLAIRQRTAKDIWQQLYEFPMIENTQDLEQDGILARAEKQNWFIRGKYEVVTQSPVYKQQLSHQLIAGKFIHIRVKNKPAQADWQWVNETGLGKFAFPRVINQFLQKAREQSLF
jgi:A/G-specific adenine glycosylase